MCLMTQKRFEGTRVTVETFLVWKAKFDSELAELRCHKGKDDTSNKKLTGTDCVIVDAMIPLSDKTVTVINDSVIMQLHCAVCSARAKVIWH